MLSIQKTEIQREKDRLENPPEKVEELQEELELEKELLDQTKASVEAEQQTLEELIEQKHQDIISFETDNNSLKA